MVAIYALIYLRSKAYVGSTKASLGKRLREHRCLLNQGLHKTKALQDDWIACGGELWAEMMLLEVLPPEATLADRRDAEIRWMDVFAGRDALYNEHRISMRPTDEAIERGVTNAHREPGNRWTPEVNERRSKAQLGKPKGHGAKISATKRAKREQAMR